MKEKIIKNLKKTLMWFKEFLPLLIAILLLVSILKWFWFFDLISKYLSDNFLSVLLADLFGSISAWSTINSYIIAHQIWNFKDYFLVITVFLIAWITVWVIQMPAEIYFFWKRFAIVRNIISFIFAIIGAYIIYFFYYL